MRDIIYKIAFSYRILPILLCLGVIVGIFAVSGRAEAATESPAAGQKLITLHDNGQTRGILTSASTLREAFKVAKIEIDPNDLIEPGLDEPLTAINYDVNVYRARPIVIVDGEVRSKVLTPYRTAKQIIEHAKMTVYPEDTTDIAMTSQNILTDGVALRLTIKRATPFSFTLYGKTITARTQAKTVGAMLKEKKIVLAENDRVSLDTNAPISAGTAVRVWREGKQTISVDEEVAFTTERINDTDKEVGFREIKTPGKNGMRTATYEIVIQDGNEVGRTEIASITTLESIAQVELVGTKNKFSGSLNEWLLALRTCETGGNYARNSGNGYFGAYQFLPATWDSAARKSGRPDLVGVRPDLANPADQDMIVVANTNLSGSGLASQHPGCYKKLGLSQFPPN